MRSHVRRLAESSAAAKAERQLLAGDIISDDEILKISRSLFNGRWVGLHHYRSIQQALQCLVPQGAAARAAVSEVLKAGYHVWLQRFTARRLALAPGLAYTVNPIPTSTANNRRPGSKMTPAYLTIHSTANPTSTAGNERNWLTNPDNKRTASFHIVVDDNQAIECIPFDEVAWHARDGNGDGNKKSISLEICESGDRARALRNAIAVAARILRDRDLEPTALRRHRDWTSKMCPRILIVPESRKQASHTWEWFKAEVTQLV